MNIVTRIKNIFRPNPEAKLMLRATIHAIDSIVYAYGTTYTMTLDIDDYPAKLEVMSILPNCPIGFEVGDRLKLTQCHFMECPHLHGNYNGHLFYFKTKLSE